MGADQTFPCTSCGLCCYQAARIKLLEPSFPYKAREDGSCEKLVGRRCSVYKDRPEICNIDRIAERYHLDKQEFYRRNAAACNALIEQAGEDPKYRVIIKERAA